MRIEVVIGPWGQGKGSVAGGKLGRLAACPLNPWLL